MLEQASLLSTDVVSASTSAQANHCLSSNGCSARYPAENNLINMLLGCISAARLDLLQALFQEARRRQSQQASQATSSKTKLSLDKSAVAIARELSKRLDEAPQEAGGCPFMVTTAAAASQQAAASDATQAGFCPFSSSHAAQTDTQTAQASAEMQTSACPFSGATAGASKSPLQQPDTAAMHTNSVLGSLPDEADLDKSSESPAPPTATASAAACPFHFGNKENIPSQNQPSAVQSASSEEADVEAVEPMTEDALREYEQAFSMDPDEAMLQAYAALLADKVAETDMAADDRSAALHSLDTQAGLACLVSADSNDGVAAAQAAVNTHLSNHADAGNNKPNCMNRQLDPGQDKTDPVASTGTTCTHAAGLADDHRTPAADSITDAKAKSTFHDRTQQPESASWAEAGLSACRSWMGVIGSLWQELLQQPPRWHAVMIACFGIQLVMTLYFSLVHQRYALVQCLLSFVGQTVCGNELFMHE